MLDYHIINVIYSTLSYVKFYVEFKNRSPKCLESTNIGLSGNYLKVPKFLLFFGGLLQHKNV